MNEHPSDALSRYDHARGQLAGIDQAIRGYQLSHHAHGHGNTLGSDQLDGAVGLLREQQQASTSFAQAAADLADALVEDQPRFDA